MKPRASRLNFKGEVEHRYKADALLDGPGAAAAVKRSGVLRSLVMACPDGCGDVLTLNLDRRAGRAWRLYRQRDQISLYPSVWRDTGCESHFIVWRSVILWCDYEPIEDEDDELTSRVLEQLTSEFIAFGDIADRMNEVPWPVLAACERLVSSGKAQRGIGKQRECFRLRASNRRSRRAG